MIRHREDRKNLAVVRDFLDVRKSLAEIAAIEPRFAKSSGEFKAEKARQVILHRRVRFSEARIVSYPFKPFDVRAAYLDPQLQPLFSRPAPQLCEIATIDGNEFLITRDTADARDEGPPFYFSRNVCDYDCISGHARHFPLLVQRQEGALQSGMGKDQVQLTIAGAKLAENVGTRANLSSAARKYLSSIGAPPALTEADLGRLLWNHVLAVGFSAKYLGENRDGVKMDWPRVPLPSTLRALQGSAALGTQVAGLLDMSTAPAALNLLVPQEYGTTVANVAKSTGGPIDPGLGDLSVKAGWGHRSDIVMPGKGTVVVRNLNLREEAAVGKAARSLKSKPAEVLDIVGTRTVDVFLNDVALWENVPEKVWQFVLGGHQVLKKWLSYREFDVVGRSLTVNEVREFTDIARRILGLLFIRNKLDANYELAVSESFDWRSLSGP